MPAIKLSPSRTKPAKLNGNGAKPDYHVHDLSLADLGRREVPAGALHAQAPAREHAGRTGWKASLGLDFTPPLLGLH